MFSHEKMRVYQAAKQFLVWRVEILAPIKRRVSALDHLQRASESIGLNIAHASSAWGKKERMNYIGHANGSALECAAALDVLAVKELVEGETSRSGKEILASIVGMLFQWRETTANQLKEGNGEYMVSSPQVLFAHEKLDVYRVALDINRLIEQLPRNSGSHDLMSKIDKSATSIALNIAEGNGRYSSKERVGFFGTAYRAAVQAAALSDMTIGLNETVLNGNLKKELNRVTVMLAKLRQSVE